MSHASAIPPGGSLGTTRRGWTAPVNRVSDSEHPRAGEPLHIDLDQENDPYADDPKWPAWKVTLAVVFFCAAFWSGISYLATRIFG